MDNISPSEEGFGFTFLTSGGWKFKDYFNYEANHIFWISPHVIMNLPEMPRGIVSEAPHVNDFGLFRLWAFAVVLHFVL